jgi:sialic acid synthase SpsE
MITIGDISSNHEGSLEKCKQIIQELKDAGGSIAKIQLWNTDTFINKKEFDNLGKLSHQKNWTKSVYETYKQYQVPLNWLPILEDYCKNVKIGFAVTCYDIDNLETCIKHSCIVKIGSGEITNLEMLVKSAQLSENKPILLATGASTLDEVIQAVNVIEQYNRNIVIMQCITDYTNNPENLKYSCINTLKSYKTYFPDYNLGLSDHSKSCLPVILSRGLGAIWLERHFKGSKENSSPDNAFSLNSNEWKYMMKEIADTEMILGNTFKTIMPNEIEARAIQRRCWYSTKDLIKGHSLKVDDMIAMRPALPPDRFAPTAKLEGKKLKKDVKQFEAFTFSNVELG